MEFNERITKVIEHSGLTPAEFAEEVGVQRSSISHIISGRNKPSLDFITKIKLTFPEIEWQWLILGEGEMLVEKSTESVVDVKSDDEILEPKKESKTETPSTPSLPDLFSFLENDEPLAVEKPKEPKARESKIPEQTPNKNTTADSQRLQKQKKNIRRIVFFYEDGTFEAFEN